MTFTHFTLKCRERKKKVECPHKFGIYPGELKIFNRMRVLIRNRIKMSFGIYSGFLDTWSSCV